jgi:energy-coupling factor transport system ATP-binding protein
MSVRIETLVYRYPTGVTALDGVSLRVSQGERVALIGQNGAGKTTLARHLNGIYRPTAGAVHVDGWDTAERSIAELAGKVGYLFQNPDEQLFARTVADEVAFGPRNLGYAEDRRARLVAWALEATRLTGMGEVHPYQLSLAERKRVALASVLAMDTPIVVLDEPTTGADHAGVQDVGAVVAELAGRGRTVLAVTHDMDFCAEHFDRVVVLAAGRVVLDGTPDEVFRAGADLARAGVEPPQLIRLGEGLGWSRPATTVDTFVDRLAAGDAEGVAAWQRAAPE